MLAFWPAASPTTSMRDPSRCARRLRRHRRLRRPGVQRARVPAGPRSSANAQRGSSAPQADWFAAAGHREPVGTQVPAVIPGGSPRAAMDRRRRVLAGQLGRTDVVPGTPCRRMLREAGFGEQSWFAAYPDYKLPSCLVHESMFDSEDGRALVKQFVRTPTTEDAGASLATADSIAVLHSAIDSGLGMSLANSFVVICGSPGNLESHESEAGILAGVPQRARAWRSARVLARDERGWRLRHLGSPGPRSNWPLRLPAPGGPGGCGGERRGPHRR